MMSTARGTWSNRLSLTDFLFNGGSMTTRIPNLASIPRPQAPALGQSSLFGVPEERCLQTASVSLFSLTGK